MDEIVVEQIIKCKNFLQIKFSYTEGLKEFFSGSPFVVEYSEEIENVPDAIAVIPFVCNVLPLVWLTDSKLSIQSIDNDFFYCLDEIKTGYKSMYTGVDFKGEIVVETKKVIKVDKSNKKAMLYSGGLDSVHTLIEHLDEKPDLISIWGSDIQYQNKEGWEKVYKNIQKITEKFDLNGAVIRSSFRDFDKEFELDKVFKNRLQDSWWHGIKHGMGLLGHIAPYIYLHKISAVYIASSNCQNDGKVKCASDPTIDNRIRFCGCKVIHYGFDLNRQQKTQKVVEYCNTHNTKVDIHVCWKSQKGSNCGKCEKCYRTMAGLIAEGADPYDYGFKNVRDSISNIQSCVLLKSKTSQYIASTQWNPIKERISENKRILKNSIWWKNIKWIEQTDFNNITKAKLKMERRVKLKKIKRKTRQIFLKLKA